MSRAKKKSLWRRIADGKISALVAVICGAVAVLTSCENDKVVRGEEERYRQEFPGREILVVPITDLTAANALVPPSREHAYQLDDRVGIEGDFYLYTVFTPHGTYTVKGLFNLPTHCREARVIEMVLSSNRSVELQAPMGDYFSSPKNPRADITVTAIDSIRYLGRSFHRAFAEWEINSGRPQIDRIDNAALNPSAALRKIAYHLRVDAYSPNAALIALLRALSEVPNIAADLLPSGEFFVPMGNENSPTAFDAVPSWGQKWATAGGQSAQAEKFLREENSATIPARLAQFYADNLHLDAAQAPLKNLLANRSYSPRQQVYIAWYLAQINARGTLDAVNFLSLAPTVFRAQYNFTQLALLHAVHCEYSPIAAFAAMQNQLAAVTRAQQFLVIPLWDHTRDRVNVRSLLLEISGFAREYSTRSQALWMVGDCDPQTIAAASERQIEVRQNVAMDAIFRFTPLRALTYAARPQDEILTGAMTVIREPLVYSERVNRPTPIYKMPPANSGNAAAFIEDAPGWNGRLAIERKLAKPADPLPPERALNETGSPTGILPPTGKDPAYYPAQDRLHTPPPKFE